MTTQPTLQARWADGETVLGAWLLSADTLITETVASLEFDYVGVDVQHGAASLHSAPDLISSLARDTTPLVRVPQNNAADIGRMLDAGALGVIVPMVESADQARAAVAACRYPPHGARSFGPARARLIHGPDYGAHANNRVSCIPMIETAQGLAHIDEILAVPGVDAIYVGPADLSLSLGLQPLLDQQNSAFSDALTTITVAARRHGVVAGIHANAGLAAKRISQGFRMITVGVDQPVLTEGMGQALDTARRATGTTTPQDRG